MKMKTIYQNLWETEKVLRVKFRTWSTQVAWNVLLSRGQHRFIQPLPN